MHFFQGVSIVRIGGQDDNCRGSVWIIFHTRRVFTKALEAGYISVNGTRLIWNDSTVLLAYMCGRIYCKDKAEKVPHENKYCWEKGQDGLPNAELTRLFQREGIGQARLNRKSATAPKKFEEIDKFFERS